MRDTITVKQAHGRKHRQIGLCCILQLRNQPPPPQSSIPHSDPAMQDDFVRNVEDVLKVDQVLDVWILRNDGNKVSAGAWAPSVHVLLCSERGSQASQHSCCGHLLRRSLCWGVRHPQAPVGQRCMQLYLGRAGRRTCQERVAENVLFFVLLFLRPAHCHEHRRCPSCRWQPSQSSQARPRAVPRRSTASPASLQPRVSPAAPVAGLARPLR